MAIIKNEMQGGQQAAPAQAAAQQGQAAPQGQTQVDPKLVDIYQRLGVAMMKVIYDKRMTPQLLKVIAGSDNPVAGVVQAAMMVVQGIGERMKGLPPQAVNSILPATVALLFELADAAKILQFEPAMLQQAQAMVQQKMGGQPGAAQAQPAGAPAQEEPAASALGEA